MLTKRKIINTEDQKVKSRLCIYYATEQQFSSYTPWKQQKLFSSIR